MASTPQILVMTFGSATISDATGHPNKMKFKGVLVRLDEPSTKAPNGADGHRILVPTEVAKRRLQTLIGMGLNYTPSLDAHAQRRKVGVITRAWIEGKNLNVEGTVWKHDFPEAEKDLKQAGLGMSMEIGSVQVDDQKEQVWKLTDFYFLGATILWQKSAAYNRTQAIAAKADKGANMADKTKMKKAGTASTDDPRKLVSMAAAAAAKAVGDMFGEVLGNQTKILAGMAARLDKLEATSDPGDDDENDDDSELTAGADDEEADVTAADDDEDEEDADEDDMDADIDKGDLTDMGKGGEESENTKPGHFNKKAKKSAPSSVLSSQVKALAAAVETLAAGQARIEKQLRKQGKQVTAAGADTNRRSLGADTIALLAKGGIDASSMQKSGQKLTVAEADALLSSTGLPLGPVERMTAKNNLLQAGLMEDGVVGR